MSVQDAPQTVQLSEPEEESMHVDQHNDIFIEQESSNSWGLRIFLITIIMWKKLCITGRAEKRLIIFICNDTFCQICKCEEMRSAKKWIQLMKPSYTADRNSVLGPHTLLCMVWYRLKVNPSMWYHGIPSQYSTKQNMKEEIPVSAKTRTLHFQNNIKIYGESS